MYISVSHSVLCLLLNDFETIIVYTELPQIIQEIILYTERLRLRDSKRIILYTDIGARNRSQMSNVIGQLPEASFMTAIIESNPLLSSIEVASLQFPVSTSSSHNAQIQIVVEFIGFTHSSIRISDFSCKYA